MLTKRIEGATRIMQPPAGWADQTDTHCVPLAIRDETIDGMNYMASTWEPTPDELHRLVCGAPIVLRILGTSHPVVSLDVGATPEIDRRQGHGE